MPLPLPIPFQLADTLATDEAVGVYLLANPQLPPVADTSDEDGRVLYFLTDGSALEVTAEGVVRPADLA